MRLLWGTGGERWGEATVRKRRGEGKAGASWVGDYVESGNRDLIYRPMFK